MITRVSFIIHFCLLSVALSAQSNQQFPSMEAESLDRKLITIPNDLNGKYTLIGLAFSKKSEEYLNSWFQPSFNQFIYKPAKPSLFAVQYDINLYFVPMFTGVKRPAYEKIMENVAKDIDPLLYPHVLFYKGAIKEYKEALNFDGKEVPYFYVLDQTGKIIYSTTGKYTEAKMQQIVNILDNVSDN